MWQDQNRMRLSSVGVTLLVVSSVAGAVVTTVTESRFPLVIGVLTGLYFLFSIRIADQWEKVAVLRFGRFIGLRGPGLFYMIPVVDSLSRYVDQRLVHTKASIEKAVGTKSLWKARAGKEFGKFLEAFLSKGNFVGVFGHISVDVRKQRNARKPQLPSGRGDAVARNEHAEVLFEAAFDRVGERKLNRLIRSAAGWNCAVQRILRRELHGPNA